jgi:hypothetical protein
MVSTVYWYYDELSVPHYWEILREWSICFYHPLVPWKVTNWQGVDGFLSIPV